MLDLTPLSEVRIDVDARRAWVAGGALLGALDRAARRAHGLATTAGERVAHGRRRAERSAAGWAGSPASTA